MVILIALALGVGGFALARSTEDDAPRAKNGLSAAGTVPVIDPAISNEPIAAVAAAVSPSVVQIETSGGLGSGFIYDAQGYILTAAHVVDSAGKTVKVRLADGALVNGQVIGTDNGTDVAVVKIDPKANAKVATLATGVKVQPGQTAVALGSPFGLTETVTAGIVSGVDRPETTPSGAVNMIQIDTPINPGNSGGPVADLKGRVICIADQILSQTGENNGIGFCVPIDTAKAVADKMVAGQPVEFAFLGVSTDPTSTSGTSEGAIVVEVTSGTAADKAGLQQGDTITAVNGQQVTDPVELGAAIRSHQPGETVSLTVERDGSEQSVDVTLGSTKSK
jgi:putative serine protease PepD